MTSPVIVRRDKSISITNQLGPAKIVVGAQGPLGPFGPAGPTGAAGSNGTNGTNGADGTDGVFSAIASEAEAEAGTDNTKGMTPLRTAEAIAALAGASGRPLLAAARTYYVRTDGSDSNNGLADSSGGAFLTIQEALNIVGTLDLNGYQVTIQVRTGAFNQALTLPNLVGRGSALLQGDTSTPSNVTISVTSAQAITASGIAGWTIQGFKLATATAGQGISASNGASIIVGAMEWGAVAGNCLYATFDAGIIVNGNQGLNANVGGSVLYAEDCGKINAQNITFTLRANITATQFAQATHLAEILANNNTYTAGAFALTGQKYLANYNSIIVSNATMFGSVAGSATNGSFSI